ncbi:MAG: BlaI/MecI/CopY family transcriptional regulator [Clostridia bacterium]|nr:BlaI/MecI/CopY family transcriptional regulator [Clostridia bacterium]NLS84469.1 BlaI/MecI/CopY family transcriptional regulator [Oscillospiraceae bacterium]
MTNVNERDELYLTTNVNESERVKMTIPEKLPDTELDIMLCLWKHKKPVRTSEIAKELLPAHDWSLSTLKALLGRLVEKGCVELTRDGRFTLYRALVPESAYRKREVQSVVQKYYNNSIKSMVAALVTDDALSGEDIRELEDILRKAGQNE